MPERYSAVEWEPWASMGMRKVPVDNYIFFYLVDTVKLTVTVIRVLYNGRDIEGIIQKDTKP